MFRSSGTLDLKSNEQLNSYGEEIKKTKKKRSDTFKSHAIEFFKETSVNGVAVIFKTKGCCRKLMKILILILGIIGFLFHTYQFLKLYWQYSTMTQVSRMKTIDKPAITICDGNLIRRIYFCEMKPHLCGTYDSELLCALSEAYCVDMDNYYEMLLEDSQKIEYEDEYFELNFTQKSGFQIHEALLSCKWIYSDRSQNTDDGLFITNCSKPKFVRGLTKNKLPGACYSFGSTIGESNFTTGSLKADAGLTLILKWRSADLTGAVLDFNIGKTPLRVYYVSVHTPGALSNPFIEGFRIEERNEYKVSVSQVDNVRMPPPYSTECRDYISEWKEKGGSGPLERENCKKTCEINESFEEYKCAPRDVSYPHIKPLCPHKHSFDSELKLKIVECSEKCTDACLESHYQAQSEVVGQLSKNHSEKIYGTPSVVTVEFEFDILKSSVFKDKPKYESVELFSYIGGYLGMWLGWSLVAIFDFFEIIFHVIKYPFIVRRKRQYKKSHVKPAVLDHYY